MGRRFRYISELGEKQLVDYRYTGSDNSLVYVYFCSPLADFLVRFLPLWLAPNVITLTGLALSVSGHLLVLIYAPTFKETCPGWVWFTLSLCTFAYQTLDNMDGKQARRTSSSSALGLFIDHGVDSVNIVLSSQNVMALLQLGHRPTMWACLAVWTATSTPFFFATWEEHFTGSLYLGLFNGPTDGVLIVCASYMLTAFRGQDFWNQPFVLHFSTAECIIAFYLVCVAFTLLANIHSVWVHCMHRGGFTAAIALTMPFLGHLLLGCVAMHEEANLRLFFSFLGFFFLILVLLGPFASLKFSYAVQGHSSNWPMFVKTSTSPIVGWCSCSSSSSLTAPFRVQG